MHFESSKQLHHQEPEELWGDTGWVYFAEKMPQDYTPTEDCPLREIRLEFSLLPTHLCGSELVTQQDIGDEDDNGDNNRQCCP